jgi:RHS repeat-associated protein
MRGTFSGGQTLPSGYVPVTGYTGHLNEDLSGLIYMKGRYYSPLWHRFINSDQGVDPRSINQYAYVGGSPFMAKDPSGMLMQCFWYQTIWYHYDENGEKVITSDTGWVKIGCVPIGDGGDWWADYGEAGSGGGEGGYDSYTDYVPTEKDVDCEARKAIMAAVAASNSKNSSDKKGGLHEEGGIWGFDKNDTIIISPAKPGTTWTKGDTSIGINVLDPADNSKLDSIVYDLGKYHVHPKGRFFGPYFVQQPSTADLRNAHMGINIVAGAGNKQIYFYNSVGIINKMSFKNFMKGCEY